MDDRGRRSKDAPKLAQQEKRSRGDGPKETAAHDREAKRLASTPLFFIMRAVGNIRITRQGGFR